MAPGIEEKGTRVSSEKNLMEWTALQSVLLSQANEKAVKASREWNRLNNNWNATADANGWTDIVDRSNRKAANIPLKDAFAACTYWQTEAMRISSYIQGELAARQLMEIARRKGS